MNRYQKSTEAIAILLSIRIKRSVTQMGCQVAADTFMTICKA